MALIAIAVHDTEDNRRSAYTNRTLTSLLTTVDFHKHRLYISDNGSSEQTQEIYGQFEKDWIRYDFPKEYLQFIKNGRNIGTSEAINKCWANRRMNEYVIKMDNDCIVNQKGWVEEMEYAMSKDTHMGILGLKRKDLEQSPDNFNLNYHTSLHMLYHEAGEPWVIIERSKDVMGTCVMHSPKLLDEVGYSFQPGQYGFDDVLMSIRSELAGFYNAFLPHISIDHIDTGGTEYTNWKSRYAGEQMEELNKIIGEYRRGERPLYYNPFTP